MEKFQFKKSQEENQVPQFTSETTKPRKNSMERMRKQMEEISFVIVCWGDGKRLVYQVYKDSWAAVCGKEMACQKEGGNWRDVYLDDMWIAERCDNCKLIYSEK